MTDALQVSWTVICVIVKYLTLSTYHSYLCINIYKIYDCSWICRRTGTCLSTQLHLLQNQINIFLALDPTQGQFTLIHITPNVYHTAAPSSEPVEQILALDPTQGQFTLIHITPNVYHTAAPSPEPSEQIFGTRSYPSSVHSDPHHTKCLPHSCTFSRTSRTNFWH
jgi:hypothetical protein